MLVAAAAGWSPSGHRPLYRPPFWSQQHLLALRMLADSPDDLPTSADADKLANDLANFQMDEFNKGLYEHLNKRPEYETSSMYSQLRKRQDVDDPLYGELKERREMLSNAPQPNEQQTPGEVIELVLRALRDVDWPRPGHGVEMLQSYSGPASILGDTGREVTTEMLLDYFASSKYAILLNWVSIQYQRKLELSLDKKRALQQLRLTSSEGEVVALTFQLSIHNTAQGDVWLIDQLLVKT